MQEPNRHPKTIHGLTSPDSDLSDCHLAPERTKNSGYYGLDLIYSVDAGDVIPDGPDMAFLGMM